MLEYQTDAPVKTSSNRSFGIVFGVVFTLVALWPLKDGQYIRLWAALPAALFYLLAFLLPRALAPLNRAWTKLGLLMGKVTTPIIMGIVFFGLILPIGLWLRLRGKRPLSLRFTGEPSYWILRIPPGPPPESFKNQF
jgi:hypothetical protein